MDSFYLLVTPSATHNQIGASGADSQVGGLVHALGPCGSLQPSLLWGWEFLLLPPQPPQVFSIRGLRLYFPVLELWVVQSASLPPPFLRVYLCANVGPQGRPATTLWGLPAAAWHAPFHNLPPHWVCQLPPCRESSRPQLPVAAPPTGLDECFYFISLVVGLPYSSIFCQFWLFFVIKLLLSFFWLCEEAQCIYRHLHLGWKSIYLFFRERKGERKRRREILMCGCLSHVLYWVPGPQPRHVPWLGIKLTTFRFTGPLRFTQSTEPHQPGQTFPYLSLYHNNYWWEFYYKTMALNRYSIHQLINYY